MVECRRREDALYLHQEEGVTSANLSLIEHIKSKKKYLYLNGRVLASNMHEGLLFNTNIKINYK